MYMNTRDLENESFSIGDIIVPCSSIEITHINDNKAPLKEKFKRSVVWLLIIAMLAGIFMM